MICDESMAEGSMVSDYCQGLLLKEYHSNGAGRSWGVEGVGPSFLSERRWLNGDCAGLVRLWKGVKSQSPTRKTDVCATQIRSSILRPSYPS